MSTTTARGLNHLTDARLDEMIVETQETIDSGRGGPFAQSALDVLHDEVIERAKIWADEVAEIAVIWSQPWPTDIS